MKSKNIFILALLAIFAGVAKWFNLPVSELSGVAMFAFGPIMTTDRREREDLATVIDILKLKDDDMKYLSMINFLPSIKKLLGKNVTAQKHEWLDDLARYDSITATASGAGADWDTNNDITALPLAAAEGAKLRVGDMLLLPSDEVIIVKSIATTFDAIDVIARGHGSTNAAAQGAVAFSIQIIGNAQKENGSPLASDFTAQTAAFNYTQIFESVAEVTGTIRRSKMATGDELSRQEIKKLREAMKELNRTIIEGIKDLDVTNHIGTMGGLREFITTTSNVGGSLTVAKLYTAINSHITAGLFPSAIHGSPTTIGIIEQLYLGAVRTEVSDRKAGTKVSVVNIQGYEIELHVDKHIRSTEALILDYNRIGFGPLDGGEKGMSGDFAVYPLLDKVNGKQIASQILGEYTLHVSNGGGTRMYGITG